MFDSSVGQPTSNSYVSVEYADEFFAASINQIGWPDTQPEKEAALQEATRVLDEQFQWFGIIATDTQALSWPRSYVTDQNGRQIDETVIPKRIADATCHLALYLANNGGLNQSSVNVKGLKIGPIDLKFDNNKSVTGVPQYVVSILSSFGDYVGYSAGSSHMVKAIRC